LSYLHAESSLHISWGIAQNGLVFSRIGASYSVSAEGRASVTSGFCTVGGCGVKAGHGNLALKPAAKRSMEMSMRAKAWV